MHAPVPRRHLAALAALGAVGLTLLAGCDRERPRFQVNNRDPFQIVRDDVLRSYLAEALEHAGDHDRRVLLVFLADWCEDCHEVVQLMQQEPAWDVLSEGYEVLYVNVGRFDRHRELIAEHEVDRIATLVVLAPDGARVGRRTLEPITGEQRGLTSADLAAWLERPAPPPGR